MKNFKLSIVFSVQGTGYHLFPGAICEAKIMNSFGDFSKF
jgi:hypothetical protein